jgi:hypothetical protein
MANRANKNVPTAIRIKKHKQTKSPRTKPKGLKRKPYVGQGKP